MTPEGARAPGENYLGSLHHKVGEEGSRKGPIEEPGIGITLRVLGGWDWGLPDCHCGGGDFSGSGSGKFLPYKRF